MDSDRSNAKEQDETLFLGISCFIAAFMRLFYNKMRPSTFNGGPSTLNEGPSTWNGGPSTIIRGSSTWNGRTFYIKKRSFYIKWRPLRNKYIHMDYCVCRSRHWSPGIASHWPRSAWNPIIAITTPWCRHWTRQDELCKEHPPHPKLTIGTYKGSAK